MEPGAETGVRDAGLGGTVEADTEERRMETSEMPLGNQTGDSSCPFWLRKVGTPRLQPLVCKARVSEGCYITHLCSHPSH